MKMRNELLTSLRYGGVTESGQLSAAQRWLLESDQHMKREFELNQALWFSGPPAPAAPAVAGQISLALARVPEMDTTREVKGIMHSLLAGKKWYWQAAAVVLLIAVVVAISALWPWRMSVTHGGGIGVGQETAWAAVDGFVVEFTIEFDEYYTGTAADSPDHPLWRIQALVDDWAAEHGAADAVGCARARLEIDRADMLFGEDHYYRYSLSIMVPTDDEALVDELTERLAALENVSGLKRYTQQWFYQEKYPDTHYLGRTIRINGTDYAYPQEIDTESLSLLTLLFTMSPAEEGQLLYALDDIEEFRRYGLGAMVYVSWAADGAIVIDTCPGELDFKSLGLPGWVHTINVYVPQAEKDVAYDPAELLTRWARGRKSQVGGGSPWTPRRLIVDLLPIGAWLGVEPAALAASIPAEEIAEAQQLSGRLDAALDGIKQRYPAAAGQMFLDPCKRDGVPLQWQVLLSVADDNYLVQELTRDLRAAGATAISSFPDVPTHPDLIAAELQRQQASPAQQSQRVTLQYTLLAIPDEHGHDVYLDVNRASAEQRAEAQRLADLLQRVFDDWQAGRAADSKPARGDLRIREVDDLGAFKNDDDDEVPVSATVTFAADPALAEEFRALTAAQGLPEPVLTDGAPDSGPAGPAGPGNATEDAVLVYTLPIAERLGIASDEQPDSLFTPEEQRQSQELYQRMQAALDDWNKLHEIEHVAAELHKFEAGGAVVSIYATTVWLDAETVLALAEALAVDGAPCYQYGPAFLSRDQRYIQLMQQGEKRMISGTVIGWSLLPQVRTAGISSGDDYAAEMRAEFTPEELEKARKQVDVLRVVFDEFIKLHPELRERIFHGAGSVERSRRAYIIALDRDGIFSSAGVWLYLDDRERETELAEELIAMVERTGQVDVAAHTHRQSRFNYVARE